MKNTQMKLAGRWLASTIRLNLSAAAVLLGLTAPPVLGQSPGAPREPELPAGCASIEAPPGHKVCFHAYAVGFQIYRWNGNAWVFVAPVASLYANADYDGEVGTHGAGPTWESNSGSKVIGRRIAGCSPDVNSIPWLLLETVTSEGPGVFSRVSYIQRVNTVGGLAPASAGAVDGEVKEMFYTAEYLFYRTSNE